MANLTMEIMYEFSQFPADDTVLDRGKTVDSDTGVAKDGEFIFSCDHCTRIYGAGAAPCEPRLRRTASADALVTTCPADLILFNAALAAHDGGNLFECHVTSPTTTGTSTPTTTPTTTTSVTSTGTTSVTSTATTTLTSTATTTATTVVGEDEVRLPTIVLQFEADRHIEDELYLDEIHLWIKRDIIIGMTKDDLFEMGDFQQGAGSVLDATPQYEDLVGGGGSALSSSRPAFEGKGRHG